MEKTIRNVLLSVVCLCLLATMTFAAAVKGPGPGQKDGRFARLFWLAPVLALKNATANGLYQGITLAVPNRVEKRVGL